MTNASIHDMIFTDSMYTFIYLILYSGTILYTKRRCCIKKISLGIELHRESVTSLAVCDQTRQLSHL